VKNYDDQRPRRCGRCLHIDVLTDKPPCDTCFGKPGAPNWEPKAREGDVKPTTEPTTEPAADAQMRAEYTRAEQLEIVKFAKIAIDGHWSWVQGILEATGIDLRPLYETLYKGAARHFFKHGVEWARERANK